MAIRCALLMHNYSRDRMWDDQLLTKATTFLADLTLHLSQTDCAPTQDVIQSIIDALSSNLDTEKIFVILNQWIQDSKSGISGGHPGELSRALDALLGIAI
jgi:L-cysteine:1D-myo-inositol 2-amino-2-deoxy-alpha-D-glucopyranoside ligase